MASREEVLEALHQVEDPELGMDIVDLGLLYDVDVEGAKVKVTYSLTSMGCPAGEMIQEDIDRVVRELPGVEEVESELTFEPPLTPEPVSSESFLAISAKSPPLRIAARTSFALANASSSVRSAWP